MKRFFRQIPVFELGYILCLTVQVHERKIVKIRLRAVLDLRFLLVGFAPFSSDQAMKKVVYFWWGVLLFMLLHSVFISFE